MKRLHITPGDILLMLAIVLVSLSLIFLPREKAGDTVWVNTKDGAVSYSLSHDRVISVTSNGHSLTVEIKDGAVSVTDSDCPDGLCERMGRVTSAGGVIVCAPAQVWVRIASADGGESDADVVAGR